MRALRSFRKRDRVLDARPDLRAAETRRDVERVARNKTDRDLAHGYDFATDPAVRDAVLQRNRRALGLA